MTGLTGFRLARCGIVAALLLVAACDDDSLELPSFDYEVTFSLLPTDPPVRSLQFVVEYLPAHGAWTDSHGGTTCEQLVSASWNACNMETDEKLACAVFEVEGIGDGIDGAISLIRCEFHSPDEGVDAGDFRVLVEEATATDLSPVDARIALSVEIATPTTTTTFDPDDPPEEYDVTFTAASDDPATLIGALQIEIEHPGAAGTWLDTQSGSDCRWLVESDLQACNPESNRLLICAAVSQAGFAASGAILECGFASNDAVTPDVFAVRVVDASDLNLGPIDVTVAASAVTARFGD
jgi:hypothetical protein